MRNEGDDIAAADGNDRGCKMSEDGDMDTSIGHGGTWVNKAPRHRRKWWCEV